MDRIDLERLLGQGLSLAEIGRRFDLHEATVSYWIKKHGLEAVNRGKHASRGGIGRDELAVLIEAGLSIAQIAQGLDRSKGTVRHWLKTHGLKTYAQQGRAAEHSTRVAKAAGRATVTRRCHRHGMTDFWLEGRGYYRCKRCRMEHVNRRRRKMKLILVAEAGGCCTLCGYDCCTAALHFHHVDPSTKRFHLSMQGVTRSLARARAEMEKCVLLCANCHAEVEAGVTSLPGGTARGEVA
jgi:transposase